MQFQTKQAYVAWRDAKRAEYRFIATSLRALRLELARVQSSSMKLVAAERAAARAESRPGRWRKLVVNVAARQHNKRFLRAQARAIMKERFEAKAIARASWDQWRQSNQP